MSEILKAVYKYTQLELYGSATDSVYHAYQKL